MNENDKTQHPTSLAPGWSEKILYVGLLALAAILPLFILPTRGIAPEMGKVALVEFSALGLFLVWLAGQLQTRRISISKSVFSGAFLALSVVVLLAGVFSQDFSLSMFGESFTTSEGIFVASLGLIGFLVVQIFSNFQRVIALYTAILLPFVLVLFIQILRFLFGSQFLSFGVLTSDVATLVGGWNDLGLYAGFVLLVSVVGLEFLKLKKSYRGLLYTVAGLGVFGLLLTNVPLAWVAVAIASFLIFLYQTAFRKELTPKAAKWRLPVVSLAVFVFALAGYAFVGDMAQSGLSLIRPIGYNEIRLSLGATASTVGEAWSHNFATGIGQNHFASGEMTE